MARNDGLRVIIRPLERRRLRGCRHKGALSCRWCRVAAVHGRRGGAQI